MRICRLHPRAVLRATVSLLQRLRAVDWWVPSTVWLDVDDGEGITLAVGVEVSSHDRESCVTRVGLRCPLGPRSRRA